MQMTGNQESTIINQIKGGDTRAFSVLVDRYKDLVFTLSLRMLKNREEAEEVSQDTFVKVYKALSKFKGDSKLSTWVYRVAYNSCLDRIKKNKKGHQEIEIDSFSEYPLKTLDNALETMELEEQQTTIRNCLQKLAGKDAFLLTLYYFEELSLAEISQVVNLAPNTVKVSIHRARKKLAGILRQNLEPETIQRYERTRN
ncbi:MAG: sigma-70 family RNA polymerase sigma factor [Flavobacteriaceae bacterium]